MRIPDVLRHAYAVPGILVSVVVLLYIPILGHALVGFDNDLLIINNAIVHALNPATIYAAFTTYDPELYIPLTLVSYQIDYLLGGLHPFPYHLTNIFLHAISTVLVYWCVQRLTRRPGAAIVATLMFAVHPLHTEAVAWAAARKDLLTATFTLASLVTFLRWRDEGDDRAYWWSLAFFLCALLAKITSVVLPVAFVLILLCHRMHWSTIAKQCWPFFVLSIIFGMIAIAGKTGVIASSSAHDNVLLSIKSAAFYVGQLFWPHDLSVLYPQNTTITILSPEFFLPALFCVLIVTLAIYAWRRAWILTLGIAFYLLFLLPNLLNFFKNGFLFFASDRYAYLPSIGIFLLLGILFDHLWRMGRARRAIGSLVFVLWIAFLTVTTIRHTPVWANDEALYRAAIEAYPKTALALNNLGSELMDQGRYEEAMDVLDRAITLGGHYVVPYVNKGHLFRKMRRDDDAVLAYESGISAVRSSGRLLTDDLLPFYALSEFYEKNGRMALAKDAQRRAADLAREYPEPQIQFGIFLFDHDMPDEAITAFERAIDVDPENILAHYLLAGVYLSQNNLRDAEKKLAIVVRISPSYENAAERLATIRELLGQ